MDKTSRIFIAGHSGLVGSAIVRRLAEEGYINLTTRRRVELDLTSQGAVDAFFQDERPEYVLLTAAKVGGILANSVFPAEFVRDNVLIQANVIDAAYRYGATKLLFLGSSCIYPKFAPQPMKEEHLLTGSLEPHNQAYAVAKLAGVEMCRAYRRQYGFRAIVLLPTNVYGPGDNFDLETSHVIPALIRKFHEAKFGGAAKVVVWGTGRPRREFLHVDDLADACLFLLERYDEAEPVNVGVGHDISIRELADLMRRVSGYPGEIEFDASKPDGTLRKLLDVGRLTSMGWRARIPLEDGLAATYQWYVNHTAPPVVAG